MLAPHALLQFSGHGICLVKTFVVKSEHSETAFAGLFAVPKASCPGAGGVTHPAAAL